MNEELARKILGDAIGDDNSLIPTYGGGDKGTSLGCMEWPIYGDRESILLDAYFTADVLEAIAWWMRNKNG